MASSAANGNAPTYGTLVENWAEGRFPAWEYVDESWHDFETPRGTCVEVKATQPWVSNGHDSNGNPSRARGRFKLWSEEHQSLKDDDGVYLYVLYEETDDGGIDVLEWRILDTEQTEVATGSEWYEVTTNPRASSKGDVKRIRWPCIIAPEEVDV